MKLSELLETGPDLQGQGAIASIARLAVPAGLILTCVAIVLGLGAVLPLQLASWLTFLAITIAPGYLLAEIITRRLEVDLLERLALALPLGLTALAPAGILALVLHWTLTGLLVTWITTLILIAAAWVYLVLARGESWNHAPAWTREEIGLLLLLGAAFVVMLPALSTYRIDGDLFTALAVVRDTLTGLPMNLSEPIFGSGLDPNVRLIFNQKTPFWTLWAYFAQHDLVELFAVASRSMIAFWSILAFYTMGKAAGNSRRFGLLTAAIQILIYMADPFFRADSATLFFFERTNADKFTVAITVIPVVVAFAIRYIRHGRRQAWLAGALAALAVSGLHPLMTVLMMITLAAFGGLHLLINVRDRQSRLRVAGLAGLIILGMLLPLAQLVVARGAEPLATTYPASFEGWPVGEKTFTLLPFVRARALDLYGPTPELSTLQAEDANSSTNPFLLWRFALNMNRQRLIIFDLDRYISDPNIIMEPPYLLALLLLPLLLWGLRRNLGSQYALATTLAIVFTMFNPIVTPIIGAQAVPWLLWRFIWLLPYALIIALAVTRLGALLAGFAARIAARRPLLLDGRRQRVVAQLRGNAALLAVLFATILLAPSIADALQDVQFRSSAPYVFPQPEALLSRLKIETDRSGPVTVAANVDLSVVIPAYVANANMIGHRAFTTSEFFPAHQQDVALQRLIDQNYLYDTPILTSKSLEILRRYDVRYIVATSGSELDWQLQLAPHWFEWLLNDESYSLYAVRGAPAATATIAANEARLGRDLESAEEQYRAAVAANPGDLLAVAGLAHVYERSGRFDQALSALEQIAAEVDQPAVHYRLGQLYLTDGQPEQALEELEMATMGAAQFERFYLVAADACLQMGDLDCADRQLRLVMQFSDVRGEANVLAGLGDLWDRYGYIDRALQYYEQALEIEPSERNYLALANAYQRSERFEEAERILRDLVADSPFSIAYRVDLAQLKSAQGEHAQALAIYGDALALQNWLASDAASVRLSLARTYMNTGAVEEAEQVVQQVLDLNPYNAGAHILLGNIYRERGQPQLAATAYTQALNFDPTAVAAYTALGAQGELTSLSGSHLEVLETTARYSPSHATIFIALGSQLQQLGDSEAAVSYYQSALELLDRGVYSRSANHRILNQQRTLTYGRLASLYEDQGDLEAAMNHYRAAASASTTSSSLVLLADALRRRGETVGAEEGYRQAIERDPGHIESHVRLADLLLAQGRTEEAISLFLVALDSFAGDSTAEQSRRAQLSLIDFYRESQPLFLRLESGAEEDVAAMQVTEATLSEELLTAFTTRLDNNQDLVAVQALAGFYQAAGEEGRAIALYEDVISEATAAGEPPLVLAAYHAGMGSILLQQNELDEALAAYREAANLDDMSVAALLGLASVLRQQERWDEALSYLREAAGMSPGSTTVQLAYARAREATGDADGALAIYEAVVADHPGDVRAAVALGRAYQERGDYGAAADTYEQALALQPARVEALIAAADLYASQTEYALAERHLERAIASDVRGLTAHLQLGRLLARFGRHSEVLALIEKAQENGVQDWRLQLEAASAYAALGQPELAISSLQRAQTLEPTAAEPWLQLATLYRQQGQFEMAENTLLAGLQEAPSDLSLYRALADIYLARGEAARALQQLETAAGANPESAEALLTYATELQRQGLEAQAEAFNADAQQLIGDTVSAYLLLATLYEERHDWDAAGAALDQALALDPRSSAIWLRKGRLAAEQGQREAALVAAQRATEVAPAQGIAWHSLGEALEDLNRLEASAVALERAVKVEPAYLPAYGALLEVYANLDQEAQIEQTLQALEEIAPGSYLSHLYLAQSLAARSRWSEAVAAAEDAAAMAPGLVDPWLAIGQYRIAQGHYDEALAAFEEARQLAPGNWRIYLSLAPINQALGHPNAAADNLSHAVTLEPGTAAPRLALAAHYRQHNEPALGLQALDSGLASLEQNAFIWVERALLYDQSGDEGRAVEALDQARQVAADVGQEWHRIGSALLELGYADQSLEALQYAVAVEPGYLPAYGDLLDLYLSTERTAAAEALVAAARDVAPADYRPATFAAQLLEHQEQWQAAAVALQEARDMAPDQPEPYLASGDLARVQGRLDEAEEWYRDALQRQPLNETALARLIDVLEEQGRAEAAIAEATAALELAPGSSLLELRLGRLYAGQRAFEAAEAAYLRAVELNEALSAAHAGLAELYTTLGRPQDAAAAYVNAIASRPDDPRLHLIFSELLLTQGQPDEALQMLQESVSVVDNPAPLYESMAQIVLRDGQSDAALAILQDAIAQHGQTPELAVALGETYVELGNFAAAQTTYDEALALYPDEVSLHVAYGNLEQARDQPLRALPYFERALALDPENINVQLALGETYELLNRTQEATEVYTELLAATPSSAAGYVALAEILDDRGRPQEARAMFEQGIAALPGSVELVVSYSQLLQNQNDIDGALALLSDALADTPAIELYMARAALHRLLGNYNNAHKDLRQALALSPASVELLLAYGDLQDERGYVDDALDAYQNVLELAPGDARVYMQLASLLAGQGRTEEAIQQIETAISLDVRAVERYIALAQLYLDLDRPASAAGVYRRALLVATDSGSIWRALGDVYASLEQFDEALEAYGQAATITGSVEPLMRMGDILRDRGDTPAARDAYERAHQLEPTAPEPLLRLAALSLAQDQLQEAQSYAQALVDAAPDNASSHELLGDVLARQQLPGAAEAYMTAMRLDPYRSPVYGKWIRQMTDPARGATFTRDQTRLQAALEAIAAGPDRNSLWANILLGLGYWEMENPSDRVVTYLERARGLAPDFSWLHEQLALAYEYRGEVQQARDAWAQALATGDSGGLAEERLATLSQVQIDRPADNATLAGMVDVVGSATDEAFLFYKVELASLANPDSWVVIGQLYDQPVENGLLARWNTALVPNGEYRLRLTLVDNTYNEKHRDEITVNVANP